MLRRNEDPDVDSMMGPSVYDAQSGLYQKFAVGKGFKQLDVRRKSIDSIEGSSKAPQYFGNDSMMSSMTMKTTARLGADDQANKNANLT